MLQKNEGKSPPGSAVSSGYSSVSSIKTLKEVDENNSADDTTFQEDSTTSGVRRKPSIVLMPETGDDLELNGESHDFEETEDAATNGTGGIP